MAEIRENLYALFAFEIVVYGKVTESRAALILKTRSHQNFCLNHGRKVFYINKAQFVEILCFPLVLGIIETENIFQLFVG